MAEPWERQPGETAKAFAAFQVYRDMPPSKRSLRKVAQTLGKTETLISGWSSKHGWVARVLAWDEEQDRVRRLENLEEIREVARRQAQEARALAQALVMPALRFLAKLRQLQQHPDPSERDPLGALHALELFELAVKAGRLVPSVMQTERDALGMPTTRLALTDARGQEPSPARGADGSSGPSRELDDGDLETILAILVESGAVAAAGGGGSDPEDDEVHSD